MAVWKAFIAVMCVVWWEMPDGLSRCEGCQCILTSDRTAVRADNRIEWSEHAIEYSIMLPFEVTDVAQSSHDGCLFCLVFGVSEREGREVKGEERVLIHTIQASRKREYTSQSRPTHTLTLTLYIQAIISLSFNQSSIPYSSHNSVAHPSAATFKRRT